MTTGRSVVAVVLVCTGAGLGIVSTIGVVAMRDWQDRVHYAGLASFSVFLIALAILVRESFSLIGDKALAAGLIAVLAGPVVMHVTLRSGRIRTLGDWRRNVDEERERS